MLKFAILFNSGMTFLILIINFLFKIYLAKEFSKENLVVYYSIMDIFSIIGRFFIGYKDALTTLYHQKNEKKSVMELYATFLFLVVFIIAFLFLPILSSFYLPTKIESFTLSWWYISLLFVSMNIVSFYGYMFLVTKYYKISSIQDIVGSLSWIGFVMILFVISGLDRDYKVLIIASILSNFTILYYLWNRQKVYLPEYSLLSLVKLKFPKFNDDTKKRFISLTMISSANYFVYGLLLFAPTYILLESKEIDILGDYQVVARTIYFALIAIFSWPLGRFMFPEFSSLIKEKRYRDLSLIHRKFVIILLIFALIVIFSCWFSSSFVIEYLFPPEYSESYKILNILIIALPFAMYQNFSESVIKAVGSYNKLLIIKLFGVVSFIMVYLLLKEYQVNFSSIYAFLVGVIGIFSSSIYVAYKIRKDWNSI
jgi:O-antigen/teichoic acid export membrane protein